jgi:hypothetical protein
MAPTSDFMPHSVAAISQNAEYQSQWQRIIAGTHITDWILAFVGVGQLVILGVQAGIYERQRSLMERQTQATENQTTLMGGQLGAAIKSADAAKNAADAAIIAAHADRAWLFVEEIKHIDMTRQPDANGTFRLKIVFKIQNVGRTPAIVTEIDFRAFSQINFFKEPDPENAGINGIEIGFSGLMETNPYREYPTVSVHGLTPNQVTIGANAMTGLIEASGNFKDIPVSPPPGVMFQKINPWDNIYCLIKIKYLDLYRESRETSFYKLISHFRNPQSPRDNKLDDKYNRWN